MMTAGEIARALGKARRNGRGWSCRCPAHEDRTPSLSLRDGEDGRLLVYCFAGCSFPAVVAALRQRGLVGEARVAVPLGVNSSRPKRVAEDEARIRCAAGIWAGAIAASGSPVELYLRSRGITLPVPAALRFAPSLQHGPSGRRFPAMLAAVQSWEGEVTGVHRTFLDSGGSRKANVDSPKMMLGVCAGGAVRLAPAGPLLAVGEGIETCLSVMQATGIPAWAALSTSGLRSLILPDSPRANHVVVFADADPAGEEAALIAGQRWAAEGRRVRIARPPQPGTDFNDLLRASAEAA